MNPYLSLLGAVVVANVATAVGVEIFVRRKTAQLPLDEEPEAKARARIESGRRAGRVASIAAVVSIGAWAVVSYLPLTRGARHSNAEVLPALAAIWTLASTVLSASWVLSRGQQSVAKGDRRVRGRAALAHVLAGLGTPVLAATVMWAVDRAFAHVGLVSHEALHAAALYTLVSWPLTCAVAHVASGRLLLGGGSREPLPADLATTFAASLSHGVQPQVTVLRLQGPGVWNAFAVRSWRRRQIFVFGDLLDLLPRDEMLAILHHENGHLELAHHRLRYAIRLSISFGVPLLSYVLFGWGNALLCLLAAVLVSYLVAPRIYHRQECAADQFALKSAPAAALGRALVRMHRVKGVPTNFRAGSHPATDERLRLMGLDPVAVAAEVDGDAVATSAA